MREMSRVKRKAGNVPLSDGRIEPVSFSAARAQCGRVGFGYHASGERSRARGQTFFTQFLLNAEKNIARHMRSISRAAKPQLAGHVPLTCAGHVPYSRAMDQIGTILILSDAYCARAGVAEATLSTKVFGAGSRIAQLRGGQTDIGVRRAHKAMVWFSEHWPVDAPWPVGVERPVAALMEGRP